MNTTELDKYTEQLIEQSVNRGKYIAYQEIMALLKVEGDKHPTTSDTTLDNLWIGIEQLVNNTN